MKSHMWKQKVTELVQAMPVGTRFMSEDLSKLFNQRGPSVSSVGRFLHTLNIVEHDHNTHLNGYVWRRI